MLNKNNKLLICEYFNGKVFELFLNFCNRNNLIYVEDLKDYNFFTFAFEEKISSKNTKKIVEIFKKYELFFKTKPIWKKFKNKLAFKNIKINDDFKNYNITDVIDEAQWFYNIVKEITIKTNITKLENIIYFKESYFYEYNLSALKQYQIYLFFNKFDKPYKLFLKTEFELIQNTREFNIYIEYTSDYNNTYDNVGKNFNLSRERIRQITDTVDFQLYQIFKITENYIIENNIIKNNIFDLTVLNSYFNKNDVLSISNFLKRNNLKRIKYLRELNKFFVDTDINSIKLKFDNYINSLPNIFNINNYIEKIKKVFENESYTIDEPDIRNYILSKNYYNINNYYSKNAMYLHKISLYIIIHWFDGIIKMNKEYFRNFEKILFTEFKINKTIDRLFFFEIVFNSNPNVFLQNSKNSFIFFENSTVDNKLTEHIKIYVQKEISEKNTITFKYIYNLYKDELLEKTGINNLYHFMGVFKYLYPNEFNYKKLFILNKNTDFIKTNEIIERYVFEEKKEILIDKIINDLKIEYSSLSESVVANENLIKWNFGREIIHINNLKLPSDFEKILNDFIVDSIRDNYTNSKTIFNENKSYFIENGIKNYYSLTSLIKYFFKEKYIIKHYNIFTLLFDKEKLALKNNELIQEYIKNSDGFSYKNLRLYLKTVPFNEKSFFPEFAKIRNKYIQISEDDFLIKEKFIFDEIFIENLKTLLETLINDNKYLIISDTDIYKNFPVLKNKIFNWNDFLLKSLTQMYFSEYKILLIKRTKNKGQKLIFIKTNLNLKTYSDFLNFINKNKQE